VPVFSDAESDAVSGSGSADRPRLPWASCGPDLAWSAAYWRTDTRDRPSGAAIYGTDLIGRYFRSSQACNRIWAGSGPAVSRCVQLWHGRMADGIPGVRAPSKSAREVASRSERRQCARVSHGARCGWQRGESRFGFTRREAGRYSGTILNRLGLTGAIHRAAFAAKGAARSVPGRACASDRDPRSPRCRLR
jgi:hypothetical protein